MMQWVWCAIKLRYLDLKPADSKMGEREDRIEATKGRTWIKCGKEKWVRPEFA
jgi:hypothetical protein